MAFLTTLGIVLSNNNAAARLENRTETLQLIATVLDGVTCIALAALAIAGSMGALGNMSSGIQGVLAGTSFGIGFMVLKSIINLAIRKISKKNLWGTEKTKKYLTVSNMILDSSAAIVITLLCVHSIKIISRAGYIPSFYSGFGASSGAVIFGSLLFTFIAKILISSACNKSKKDLESST